MSGDDMYVNIGGVRYSKDDIVNVREERRVDKDGKSLPPIFTVKTKTGKFEYTQQENAEVSGNRIFGFINLHFQDTDKKSNNYKIEGCQNSSFALQEPTITTSRSDGNRNNTFYLLNENTEVMQNNEVTMRTRGIYRQKYNGDLDRNSLLVTNENNNEKHLDEKG
ncbi:MAG: hypothetical protein LBK53_04735 [Heliobacteriaceae bacterium]|jgi:hypothetical protein|nr:hypothetical protein [Heliobacteriaceae bacterium]